jgi:hypothetical protein
MVGDVDCNRFEVSLMWSHKGLHLMPESEVTSEQGSNAKDGNLFSAERNQLKIKTE